MEALKLNPILDFNDNHLQIVRKNVGYEDVKKLNQDIEQLKDWIQKQSHFRTKEFGDAFLERLLIYNKGSIERAKQKFDRLLTCTNLMPDFLQNYDVKNEFLPLFHIANVCMLPKPTEDNYRVLLVNLTGLDHKDLKLIDFYRYFIVFSHYNLCHDYCHGYELIGDLRYITMDLVKKLNPVTIHKALTLITEAMGQRMKKIHLVTDSKFFETVVTLIKQGLSAKLKQRLMAHHNIESLYQHISRERLPKELGGDERSVKELCDMDFKEMCKDEHIARIQFMESAGTDESCRQVGKFNEEYSGMPGSFKTLCVD